MWELCNSNRELCNNLPATESYLYHSKPSIMFKYNVKSGFIRKLLAGNSMGDRFFYIASERVCSYNTGICNSGICFQTSL
jgi:hypothetical protein